MRIVSEEEIGKALVERAEIAAKRPRSPGEVNTGEPRIVASGNFATPQTLISILDKNVERYRLFMLNAWGVLPDRDGIILETPFTGPAMRARQARLDYLPMRLSLVPQMYQRVRPPDITFIHTSSISAGKVSLGIEVNTMVAAVEQARARNGLVVAQINKNMPYTIGDGELPCDEIDLAIEVDTPLPTSAYTELSDSAAAIGEHIAPLIGDGATLQLGIGAIPDAVLAKLLERKGLAVWTEMISNGVLELDRHGSMDQSRPIITSFMFGSEDLYHWVDHNPRVRVLRTETTNDPSMIARQPGMASINSALQVDLYAQANADRVHGRIYSGFGGQPDFTVGAIHSQGGLALIALGSWHEKSNSSTIVPRIDGQITSFQHSALITEHGVAPIFGRSQRAQAELIIENIADPRARDMLLEEAGKMGLLVGAPTVH